MNTSFPFALGFLIGIMLLRSCTVMTDSKLQDTSTQSHWFNMFKDHKNEQKTKVVVIHRVITHKDINSTKDECEECNSSHKCRVSVLDRPKVNTTNVWDTTKPTNVEENSDNNKSFITNEKTTITIIDDSSISDYSISDIEAINKTIQQAKKEIKDAEYEIRNRVN